MTITTNDLCAALIEARRAINSMKVEAETAGAGGDEQMLQEACETISNEGLTASMAIDVALAAPAQPVAVPAGMEPVGIVTVSSHKTYFSLSISEWRDDYPDGDYQIFTGAQVQAMLAAAPAAAQPIAGPACDVPPGWRCTRMRGHPGPCAAVESPEDKAFVERGMRRIRDAEDAQRYRLMKRGQHWSVIDGAGNTLRAEALDAAVDAAIAAQQGDGA